MRSFLSSWRFLLSRRWGLFFLAVLVVAGGTWWLGEWQFGRLEDRKDSNAVVRANEERAAVQVSEVLAPGRAVAKDDEWRLVTATGKYDVDDTVVVRYRTRKSQPGVEVVVPLVTTDGTTLLVDRGWYATDDPQIGPDELPAPPSGEVTVTGWVRSDGTGASTAVTGRSTRAIASGPIGEAIGQEVFGGFMALKSEDPAPAEELAPVTLPELGQGPHFFYGLQWWFFGVLAFICFGYLAWDERKNGPRGQRKRAPGRAQSARTQSARDMPPSTGTIAPETNEDAGESRKAATLPNSSGAP
ncbi:SURF1 family protein [Nocardioides sp. zg-ZUI104]|uniref:SURF1 family cytochrome oxidase biogenesis protein n=1 Tax=Nocardioides faecalis TaxID=2803858 RepID=UPI001BCAC569|nr:SURF1 family protein [Nocardioides faecalis]MBS4753910.1 SURF1 family protein [Nocardioides faecalis]